MASRKNNYFEEKIKINGRECTFFSIKVPMIRAESTVEGIFVVSININRLKNEINEVASDRDSIKSTLQNIIDNLLGHVYWFDKNNIIKGCNVQQAVNAGFKSPEDLIGQTNFDMPWRENANEIHKINNEVMRTGQEHCVEETSTLINGKVATFLSRKVPLYDKEKNVEGILGLSLDITELKLAEKKAKEALKFAEEAERRRKEFLSNQEHDINTALSGIIYGAYMFQNISKPKQLSELKESADMIIKCAQRLQDYNRSLLKDLSWLNNEGKIIERRADIRKILEKLYEVNYLAAKAKGNKFSITEVNENIPQYIMVDDIALFQCLQDLCKNSINFTENGEVVVDIKLPKTYLSRNPVVAFHVIDTGRGIKNEHQRYIFEDYYKVLPSNLPDQAAGLQADEDKG